MTDNEQLVAENFRRFQAGDADAVKVTWAPDAVWRSLDATFPEPLDRDSYFSMLASFTMSIPDYGFEVRSVTGYGEHLVVAHLDSWGTGVQPGGGLMIFRIESGMIAECWSLSRGTAATGPF